VTNTPGDLSRTRATHAGLRECAGMSLETGLANSCGTGSYASGISMP
jgi:hypothetical protein